MLYFNNHSLLLYLSNKCDFESYFGIYRWLIVVLKKYQNRTQNQTYLKKKIYLKRKYDN